MSGTRGWVLLAVSMQSARISQQHTPNRLRLVLDFSFLAGHVLGMSNKQKRKAKGR